MRQAIKKAEPVPVIVELEEPETREPRVQSVAKAANILFAVAHSSKGLKPLEIVERLGLSRQATYHLLHTLVTLGMLTKGPDNRFLLGLRIGALAEAFSRHLAAPERLLPYVRQMASETGETAYACGWWEGEIATLAVVRGRNAVQTAEVPHGNYSDAHARASGKLLLAFAESEKRERYLASHELTKRTPTTITDLRKLQKEFQAIIAQGFAVDNEEYAPGTCCAAVPISEGTIPYALSISAPCVRWAKEKKRYIAIMQKIAKGAGA